MSHRSILPGLIFVLLLAGFAVLPNFGSRNAETGAAPTATPEERRCKPCFRPEEGSQKENKPPDITALDLDKTEIQLPCPSATPNYRGDSVSVATTAVDPDGDVLMYNYTVSGGRIVGTGKNVMWDLTKVQPGTYVIIAGADDGCGVCGRTEKKSVIVTACPTVD
jgi:hypothetical protein